MTVMLWVKKLRAYATSIRDMARLAWQAQPAYCAGILGTEVAQAIVPIATAWVTKLLFDHLAGQFDRPFSGDLTLVVLPLAIALGGLTILNQLMLALNRYLNGEFGRRITFIIEERAYQKITGLQGLAPFEDPQFYDMLHLGIQNVQHSLQRALYLITSLGRNIVTVSVFLGLLIVFNPYLVGVIVLAMLPAVYVQVKLSQQRYGMIVMNSPKERRANYYGMLLSGLESAKELRLFDLADYLLQLWRRTTLEIHDAQRRQQRKEFRWEGALSGLESVVAAGALIVVVLGVIGRRLSLGDVTLYISAVGSMQHALAEIIAALTNGHEGIRFYNQFTQLLALPQPLLLANPARPVPPLRSTIELRNVSFRYSDQHPWILRDITLRIPAKQCLALVGLNGAGKTTLVKLLMRYYDPTHGQILWDGIDIRLFDPQKLRRRMGAILQDFMRYSLTAYENIAFGDIAHIGEHERVRQAAIQAGIHETIERLPHGYQTLLSRWLADDNDNMGSELSGGQWQKLALARMFIRTSDLLILDEPTAALDAQAEYALYQHFVELIAGRTSLLISHRFSTVRMADIIAVLDGGAIREYGTHDELIARQGYYARLYHMQADQYDRAKSGYQDECYRDPGLSHAPGG